MFRKPFVVKKNNNMRNSDVKKFLNRLPPDVSELVPKKALVAHAKLSTYNGTTMNMYLVDKEPMFFDFDSEGVLFPTVYCTRLAPLSFPMLLIHEPVLRNLENGADLMLQGVVRKHELPMAQFARGDAVTISIISNGGQVVGPMVIGTALMSSQDIIANRFEGRGVQVLHIFRDLLCGYKKAIASIHFVLVVYLTAEFQFYAQCLLKCVPKEKRLDMKKTKYKKFSVFLDEVNKSEDGRIIQVRKEGKGCDVIVEVFKAHPAIRSFVVTDEVIHDEEAASTTLGPKIHEYYSITEGVLPVLRARGNYSKGQLLEGSQIRDIVTNYVKNEDLSQGNKVRLDPVLAQVTKISEESTDWNTLIQKIQNKMTKTFVLRMPDGRELVRKINMPKIVFKVESRAGNKKVTLINNLSVFGIEAKKLCHQIQVEAATSATTTSEAVNCEGPQITVLGNQVNYLGDLLMNDYGIDKKYIEGLDLGIKKKRK
ncbi:unnamed protein product [Heligmosomoides polygyrus]|uniref:SUI1 domain-containing protein n=1 Tax=Heligmosomoides polygyrus TaxID=6339 RepID=A0A3P7X294_HELPZ|nr:unnamed protein product [Heligmosomoides polygyrus]